MYTKCGFFLRPFDTHQCHGTAVQHAGQTGLSRHLNDIQALLSVRVLGCQKLQMTAKPGLAQDALQPSRVETVGIKTSLAVSHLAALVAREAMQARVDSFVHQQKIRPRESLRADLADIRPFAGMNPHVGLEAAALREAHLTDETRKRLAAGVSQKVLLDTAPLREPGATDRTAERLLSAVAPHVSLQIAAVSERRRAQRTRERLLAGVDADVPRQVVLRHERLRALAAHVRPEPGVHATVHQEPVGCAERLRAHLAHVRLGAGMDPHVSVQRAAFCEHDVAHDTGARLVTWSGRYR